MAPDSMAPVVRSVFLIGSSSLTGFFSSMAAAGKLDQLAVEHLVEVMVLAL